MKKILTLVIAVMMTVINVNAGNYYESPKLTDNVYLEIEGIATTPLDFNSVFPLNGGFGLKLGKDFSPVFGANIEGSTLLNDNHWKQQTERAFKVVNVGVNATVNLSNLFVNTNHAHKFNVSIEAGLGWMHFVKQEGKDMGDGVVADAKSTGRISEYSTKKAESPSSVLSGKVGLNVGMFIGKGNVWEINANPFVMYNLTNIVAADEPANQFNKNKAQLGLAVGLKYYFQNSYKKRGFNYVDVDGLNKEINTLKSELEQANNRPEKVVTVKDTKVVEKNRSGVITVSFDVNSAELTAEAKSALDQIVKGTVVDVEGFASADGTDDANNAIAAKRTDAVEDYLKIHGAIIGNASSYGATGKTKQRVVYVHIK